MAETCKSCGLRLDGGVVTHAGIPYGYAVGIMRVDGVLKVGRIEWPMDGDVRFEGTCRLRFCPCCGEHLGSDPAG